MTYPDVNMLINGSWTKGTGGDEPIINPATGDEIGRTPHASTSDLDSALDAAELGFRAWSGMSPFARQQVMEGAARLLEERRDEIATWCTLEMGKPLPESLAELDFVIGVTRWCGEEGRRAYGRVIPGRAEDIQYLALVDPVGPACGFAAWNFPGTNVIRKIAHALGAGCSMLLKPSEETPATAMGIAAAFHDAGVPKGALQIVFGNPPDVSSHLLASPILKKVSVTGSIPVGKLLAKKAADTLKRTTMELGGHAPVMIFADADIDAAAKAVGAAKFRNAGQVCISPTRFLVEEAVYPKFVDALTSVAKAQVVGDGMVQGTTMGPLIAERRVDVMQRLVEDAVSLGARVTTGGQRVGNVGSYYAPTVLADVPDGAAIMNEEPFGPIAPISSVSGPDEMFARANRLNVGLAAYAFTKNADMVALIRRDTQAGMTGINTAMISLPETPFGGVDESGYGHEGGIEGLTAYQQTRLVVEHN